MKRRRPRIASPRLTVPQQYLARFGIRVNCLAPGSILVERNTAFLSAEPVKSGLSKAIPLGGPGTAEQVARAALFLASDESSFVTGASYHVDGGVMPR